MENDIGNTIEYNPTIEQDNINEEQQQREDETMYYPPTFAPQHQYDNIEMPQTKPVRDIFSEIDKNTWIIAFAVFLLGFFMGKTMQPVILRYT